MSGMYLEKATATFFRTLLLTIHESSTHSIRSYIISSVETTLISSLNNQSALIRTSNRRVSNMGWLQIMWAITMQVHPT